MKKLISLIFSLYILNASTLTITSIKDNTNDLYVLNLSSKNYIDCNIENNYKLKDKIRCKISNIEHNITKENIYFLFKISKDLLTITPKYKYKIYKKNKKIYDKLLFETDDKPYNSIEILFFKDRVKYDNKYQNSDVLNFDIEYKESEVKIIDVLKDDLRPILNSANTDKINYIKELFSNGKYDSVLDNCRRLLKDDSNLFKSELYLYKIRAMDRLLDSHLKVKFNYDILDSIVNNFIDRFPSDKNLPEVLFYKVKIVLKKGKYAKAVPHIVRLSKNFPDSIYTHEAEILKSEKLFLKKDSKSRAIKLLKDILYKTKYESIALKSAFNLVKNFLNINNSEQASFYLEKILKAKDEYLLEDFKKSFSIAKKFASQEAYSSANKICTILMKSVKDESLYKNCALWLEKSKKNEEAYSIYKRYTKEFENGIYIDLIKERMDKVLLDINETNNTKQHEDIDKVIENYRNDPIYKKALIKKVELFDKEKKFKDILALKDKLSDINQTSYVDSAATKLFDQYIKDKRCKKGILLVRDYNISVDNNKSYDLAKCYISWARYEDADKIIESKIDDINITSKVKWLYLGIKTSYHVNKYQQSISMYEDLNKLTDLTSSYSDILFTVFYSYLKQGEVEEAINISKKLESIYAKNPKLIDVYDAIVKYAKKNKNDMMLQLYARKLLKLQKDLKVQTYSPRVDLLLIQALGRLNMDKKALSYFADAILTKKIDDVQRAQLLYLAGELSLKQKNQKQAKEFFIKCGTDIKSSMWQRLCSDSLKLLED